MSVQLFISYHICLKMATARYPKTPLNLHCTNKPQKFKFRNSNLRKTLTIFDFYKKDKILRA